MKIKSYIAFAACLSILMFQGCKKFIEVDSPITTTNAGNVYNNDATAAAVLTGIYSTLSADDNNISSSFGALNYLPSLAADELTLVDGYTSAEVVGYYKNALREDKSLFDPWSKFYNIIFRANSAIEGLGTSQKLTSSVKAQLLGEAYFIRAFCYFYLINIYSDVPLSINTDYKLNAVLARTTSAQVYAQVKDDLVKAQSLLSENYLDGTLLKTTTERVRPNKYVVSALLARMYLYTNDWQNAEAQASIVINNNITYDTLPLNQVFQKNSKETIWALQPTGTGTNANTGAGRIFVLPTTGPSNEFCVYMNDDLVNSFDLNDQRASSWVNSVTALGIEYSYSSKYKIGSVASATVEYPIILRLAEQFLIRAEARAQLNKLTGINSARTDLDVIRTRAGLGGTTATSQPDLLTAILTERRHELFAEWGHRWFDLKRTKMIDAVMVPATAKKGGTWNTNNALYPIPLSELQKNPNLIQNKDY